MQRYTSYPNNPKIMQTEKVIDYIVNWLKDYAVNAKVNGFVVGVSGGIDSAVTSTLCAKTGLDVLCIEMPIHQAASHVSRANEHMAQLKKRFSNVKESRVDLTPVFEEFKTDGVWLQRAMNRMYAKECNDDPLFVKIVEQKNALEPNAVTAFYLGILKDKAGKSSEALSYYNQAVDLESDNFEKSKILYKIATNFKKKGRYGQARTYFMKALKSNPSLGRAHLAIAAMYAKSANNCGTDNFSKRAVYWLAAKEAAKAGRIDPTMKKNAAKSIANYEAKAPTKSEIFSSGRAGQVIKVECWIQRSVTVPSLK